MTRNAEVDCRDLFDCKHELEIPIAQHGEIVEWRCRCGARVEAVPAPGEAPTWPAEPSR